MLVIDVNHYLIVSGLLFTIGVVGILINRRSLISILMCVELILLAVNINFVAFSSFLNDYEGQIMVLFVLSVAAAEVAIGLAILVLYFKSHGSIGISDINTIKE